MQIDPAFRDFDNWDNEQTQLEYAAEARDAALHLEQTLFAFNALAATCKKVRQWTMCPQQLAPVKQVVFDLAAQQGEHHYERLCVLALTIAGRALRSEPVPEAEGDELAKIIDGAAKMHVADMNEWLFKRGLK